MELSLSAAPGMDAHRDCSLMAKKTSGGEHLSPSACLPLPVVQGESSCVPHHGRMFIRGVGQLVSAATRWLVLKGWSRHMQLSLENRQEVIP